MFSAAIIFVAAQFSPFIVVDRADPITDERQLAIVTVADDNMLAIGCSEVGEGQIFIRFIPERYYGPGPDGIIWEPNLIYRFGREQPEKTEWYFSEDYIELGFLWSPNKAKAEFLHALSQNDRLVLRYEARQGDQETLVINYQLNNEQLSGIIRKCQPKRVTQYLEEWKSPALVPAAS